MKKRVLCLLLGLLFLAPVSSCRGKTAACTADFFAMNTTMQLTVYGSKEILEEAKAEIQTLESLLSVTDPNSVLSAVNRGEAKQLPAPAAELLSSALALCRRTGGALDVSIYPLVCAWGFTTGEYRVPDGQELAELCQRVNYENITLQGNSLQLLNGMQIDFGSVAKGYTADCIGNLLQSKGVQSALLNLGGNIQVIGKKPDGTNWKVGIRDPLGDTAADLAAVLSVSDIAVVTSGGYERNFEQDGVLYHHILDPDTGYPANAGLSSVTVVAKSGLLADALSTALFVMGPEKAAEHWRTHRDFEMILITDQGELYYTQGLEASISLPSGRKGTVILP